MSRRCLPITSWSWEGIRDATHKFCLSVHFILPSHATVRPSGAPVRFLLHKAQSAVATHQPQLRGAFCTSPYRWKPSLPSPRHSHGRAAASATPALCRPPPLCPSRRLQRTCDLPCCRLSPPVRPLAPVVVSTHRLRSLSTSENRRMATKDVNKGGLEGRKVLHPQIVRTGVRPMKRLEVDVYLDVVSCTEQAFGRLEVSIKSVSRSHRRDCSLPVAASQSPLPVRTINI
ncbi:hypothetical protein Taro_034658 [Colocasia esculenta]|uniref:Uncharacterized protein n=1 Tax=Colocasia esculenta TaxID=4460 RepID=A0A843VYB3_COLES|nr:hypothetical protein [Colocasia esculenta]